MKPWIMLPAFLVFVLATRGNARLRLRLALLVALAFGAVLA